MKQDTKETIGPRGTVAGFRPLIRAERWCFKEATLHSLEGGWRPLLESEVRNGNRGVTRKPLPPPQVETFEAHGHVWYRHVPGEACPVEADVVVDFIWRKEVKMGYMTPAPQKAKFIQWGSKKYLGDKEVIGYRFPDFPAVHTPAQQEQPVVTPIGPMKAVEATDTTKQQLLNMYHGWCDFAPDDVAECMEDVRKLLYPTDVEWCEAAFQKWWGSDSDHDMHPFEAKATWDAAWSAAKQEKP